MIFCFENECIECCPQITYINLPTGVSGQQYFGQITSNAQQYSLTSSDFTIDSNGIIQGTPSQGTYDLIVSLDDCDVTVRIEIEEEVECCPQILSIDLPSGIEGQPYSGSISSTSQTYTLNSSVFTIDNQGNIQGTPSQGIYNLNILLDNDCPLSVQIEVNEEAEICCPQITLVDLPIGIVNESYVGQITSDAQSIQLTMSGFTVSQSGQITGTSSTPGTKVGVLELDGCQTTIVIPFIESQGEIPECCPQVTQIDLPPAYLNQSYLGSIVSNADSYVLNLPGFTINNAGQITGTPSQLGQVSGTLTTISDDVQCQVQLSLNVIEPSCPKIDSISLPNAIIGQSYTGQIETLADSFLLQGTEFSIDQNGQLTGTPNVPGLQTGLLTLTQNGVDCQTNISIFVNELEDICCPKVHSVFAPTGFVGESYAGFFTADGINNTYAMTNAPVGLTIDSTNGDLSGVPTEVGNKIAVITVASDVGTCDYDLNFVVEERPEIDYFPALVNVGKLCGQIGECFVSSFEALDPEGLNVTYSMSPEIPGLTFSQNGLLTGYPEQAGTYPVQITYTDGVQSQTTNFQICILDEHPDCVKAYIKALSEDDTLTCEGYFCNCQDDGYNKWLECNTGTKEEFLAWICSENGEKDHCMQVISCEHAIDGYTPFNASMSNPVKIHTDKATHDLFVANGWAIAGCESKGCC